MVINLSAKLKTWVNVDSPKFRYTLALALVFLGFFIISYYTIDPDFGWHLMSGNYFLRFGIPAKDIFSFTGTAFGWINHEWLNDILISIIYSAGGYITLAVVFSLLWTLALLTASRLRVIFVLILSASAILPFAGIRPVVWTLLFVAILEKIYEKANPKLYFLIPAIFLLWANLHGGFIFGLLLLAIWQIFYTRRLPWLIFIASFLVVFINPYGWRIFVEIFATLTDNRLRFMISEWVPILLPFVAMAYLILFLSYHFILAKRPWRRALSIPGLTLIMAASSIRHLPIFIITSMRYFEQYHIQLIKKLNFNKLDLRKINHSHGKSSKLLTRSQIIVLSFYTVLIVIASYVTVSYIWHSINIGARYPVNAIHYIRSHPCNTNIFNSYGAGGYLIWQLPEYKYYIDGRMPSWQKDGTKYFDDYIKILNNDEFRKSEFDKYNINCIVLNKKDEIGPKSRYNTLGAQLSLEGWQYIPEASGAGSSVYVRPANIK